MLGIIDSTLLTILKGLFNCLEDKRYSYENYKNSFLKNQFGQHFGYLTLTIGLGTSMIYFRYGSSHTPIVQIERNFIQEI